MRLNFSWKPKALNLKAAKIFCFLQRKYSSNFSISECYFLNLKKLRHIWGWVFQIFKKIGGSEFSSHKNGGVGKIGVVVLKKGHCHLFSYQLTLSSVIFCECLVCVCVCVCLCMSVCVCVWGGRGEGGFRLWLRSWTKCS